MMNGDVAFISVTVTIKTNIRVHTFIHTYVYVYLQHTFFFWLLHLENKEEKFRMENVVDKIGPFSSRRTMHLSGSVTML